MNAPGRPPFRSGPFSLESLEENAPEAFEAVEEAAESGAFDRTEEFADCSRFWDAVALMEAHGLDPATARGGQVICRECGSVEGSLEGHVGEHGLSADQYREEHPTAPLEPAERTELPPAEVGWRD